MGKLKIDGDIIAKEKIQVGADITLQSGGIETSLDTTIFWDKNGTRQNYISLKDDKIQLGQPLEGYSRVYLQDEEPADTEDGSIWVSPNGETEDGIEVTPELIGAVPNSRKINSKELSEDIVLSASDVGAVSKSGDSMTGDLEITYNMLPASQERMLRINSRKRSSDVSVVSFLTNSAGIKASNDDDSATVFRESNGEETNYMKLYDDSVEFGQPITGYMSKAEVTAELAKKAPSGYGYGGEHILEFAATSFDESYDEFMAIVDETYTAMPYDSTMQIIFNPPEIYNVGKTVATMYKSSNTYGAIFTTGNYLGLSFVAYKYGGVWQPLQYINPPMDIGVEYRTTERWNGSVVYCQAFDLGTLPSASGPTGYYSSFSLGTTIGSVVRIEGCVYDGGSTYYPFPVITSSIDALTIRAVLSVDRYGGMANADLIVRVSSDMSGYTGTATVYYTR